MRWSSIRIILAAAALALGCAVAGCARLATHEEKEASFKPFAKARVGKTVLRDFIEARTAVLVAGAEPVAVETRDGEVGVKLKPTSPDGKVDVGSAAAVAADGYYLTAAHCIRRQPVFLVLPTPAGPEAFPARVVWKPPDSAPACDLAIVKVHASPPAAFIVAANNEVAIGDAVVTSGANGEAGGHLLRAATLGPDPAAGLPLTFTLVHDVPLTHGDSGGPLTTLDGKLIGVEVLVRGVYLGPREGVALRPDPAWLQDIIRKDRFGQPMTRDAGDQGRRLGEKAE